MGGIITATSNHSLRAVWPLLTVIPAVESRGVTGPSHTPYPPPHRIRAILRAYAVSESVAQRPPKLLASCVDLADIGCNSPIAGRHAT